MNTTGRGKRTPRSADPVRVLVDALLADQQLSDAVRGDWLRNRDRILRKFEETTK